MCVGKVECVVLVLSKLALFGLEIHLSVPCARAAMSEYAECKLLSLAKYDCADTTDGTFCRSTCIQPNSFFAPAIGAQKSFLLGRQSLQQHNSGSTTTGKIQHFSVAR